MKEREEVEKKEEVEKRGEGVSEGMKKEGRG